MAQKQPLGQEQRLTFRVAVRPNAGVEAHLVLAGRKRSAEVGDVSAEGLFLKLDRGSLSVLKVGASGISAQLQRSSLSQRLKILQLPG